MSLLKGFGAFISKFFGKGVWGFFSFVFIILFIVLPLIFAVIVSVEQSDPMVGVKYIYPKIAVPFYQIQEQSLLAIEQGGVYGGFWSTISFYWLLIIPLFVVWKWNRVFYKILPKTPYSNNQSAEFTNIVLAISIFMVLQMFLSLYHPQNDEPTQFSDIFTPYNAIYDFSRAVPLFIKEATVIIDSDAKDLVSNETHLNYTCEGGCLASNLLKDV